MRVRFCAVASILALVLAPTSVVAQEATPTAPAWPGYVPKLFRWDEDYGFLRNAADPVPYPLRLKYLPIGDASQAYVSFGGDYRLRVDDYGHPDFGMRAAPGFTSLQQRFLLHADAHFGSELRVFVQLGGDLESGRKPVARPSDHSHPDLAQAFVDWSFGPSDERWRLRVGRQEVAIGRYIAVRDVTNIRRTFDGARLDGNFAGWTITGLAARATRNRPAAFDDTPDSKDGVALVVVEHPLPIDNFKLDLAVIEHDNKVARYAPGVGDERRKTFGVRVFGSRDGWDFDAQVSYQTGSFAPIGSPALEIRAIGAAFEGGRTFALPWSPRLALRIDAAGGDGNAKDRRLGTFDLPYPNLSYLTDAGIFAPRNVRDLQPFVSLLPISSLTLTAGAEFLWRNSTKDAVFSAIDTPVIAPGGHGNYVATQPHLRFDWRINPLLEWQGAVVHAFPGSALESSGGRHGLSYAYSSLTARF
ncbi:Alginate export [Rhizobiales bacterium GAS188]|nr:Alginate export [Rhizobiales bacterium GAS188]